MLAGVDRSILQFDTAAQLIAPVKHMCFTKNQWLVATAQFGRRQSFFLATHTATVTLTRRLVLDYWYTLMDHEREVNGEYLVPQYCSPIISCPRRES